MPTSYLRLLPHEPRRAKFPVIDAHNHLWGHWSKAADIVRVMDEVGVVAYCDLTANASLEWREGGYRFGPADFGGFLAEVCGRHPDRYFGFTMAAFNVPPEAPLIADYADFTARCVATLRDHVARGARGLKLLKELGLHFRDTTGALVRVDDERLAPIWEECARLGVPVLMHQSDPIGFFEPVTPDNEHYDSLLKYPDWQFHDRSRFPAKAELLARRDRMIAAHPGTTFILPHVANLPEDLAAVSRLLAQQANVVIDFSARTDELGRQPYTARRFFIQHQDRILFGTDMPASVEMYRYHFRFLETFDEYFVPPDYDGTFGRHRWRVHGLGLPDDVLRKIYCENALRVIPGLRAQAGPVIDRLQAGIEGSAGNPARCGSDG
jgi:predicted TIM-barrel fold metal-dependent hydrolase